MAWLSIHLPSLGFLLIISSLQPSPYSAKPVSYNIQLISEMAQPLTVSCQARGKDFGKQTIPWSYMYQFHFIVETDVGTENAAYCELSSGNTHGKFVVFDYKRDSVNCAKGLNCQWNVKPDGLSEFYNNQENLVYRW